MWQFTNPRFFSGEAAGLTSACDSNESSLRYIAEGDLDPVTTSCSPVSVEKLYPAGRILQLDERISNRLMTILHVIWLLIVLLARSL